MKYIRAIGWQMIIPVILCGIWQLLAGSGLWSTYVLPTPAMVYKELTVSMDTGVHWRHIGVSALRVAEGFLGATVTAIPLAVLLTANKRLRRMSEGMLEFFRHVPPLALLPLIILWMGIGESSKISIVFLATVYPIFLNTLMGFRETDPKLLEMGRQYGLSKTASFLYIIVPAAVPYIVSGLRIGLGYSWRSLIGAEMIASSSGIGYWILDAQTMARSDIVVVGIIVIGLCGITVDTLFRRVSDKLLKPYMQGGERDAS